MKTPEFFNKILIIGGLVLGLSACSNSNPTVANLGLTVDALWFNQAKVTVTSFNGATLQGRCLKEVVDVEYRLTPSESWRALDSRFSSPTFSCSSAGTFALVLNVPGSDEASLPIASTSAGQKLTLYLKGKVGFYEANIISIEIERASTAGGLASSWHRINSGSASQTATGYSANSRITLGLGGAATQTTSSGHKFYRAYDPQ